MRHRLVLVIDASLVLAPLRLKFDKRGWVAFCQGHAKPEHIGAVYQIAAKFSGANAGGLSTGNSFPLGVDTGFVLEGVAVDLLEAGGVSARHRHVVEEDKAFVAGNANLRLEQFKAGCVGVGHDLTVVIDPRCGDRIAARRFGLAAE